MAKKKTGKKAAKKTADKATASNPPLAEEEQKAEDVPMSAKVIQQSTLRWYRNANNQNILQERLHLGGGKVEWVNVPTIVEKTEAGQCSCCGGAEANEHICPAYVTAPGAEKYMCTCCTACMLNCKNAEYGKSQKG